MLHQPSTLTQKVIWAPPIAAAVAIVILGRDIVMPPLDILGVFVATAIATEWVSVSLTSGGYQTFGPLVTLPAILLLGPVPAAVVAGIGVGVGNGLLLRLPLTATIFNMGQKALAILAAGYAWMLLLPSHPPFIGPMIPLQGESVVVPVVGSLVAYTAANILQITLVAALNRAQSVFAVLRDNAIRQVPTSIVLGFMGLTIILVQAKVPSQTDVYSLVALLVASFVVLLYSVRHLATQEFSDLQDAVTDLLKTLDLREMLIRLADKVQILATPDMMWIVLRRPDGTYQPALTRDVPDEARAKAPGVVNGTPGRRPLVIGDYSTDGRVPDAASGLIRELRVRSVLMVPLLAGDEPVGFISLTKQTPYYFSPYHERMIATLATQAGLAVNNARLYETSQRSLARVQALEKISERVNYERDLNAVFDLIADSAREVLGADRCGIFLGTPETGITQTFTRGLPQDLLRQGIGLAARTVRQMKPIIVPDAQADPQAIWETEEHAGARTIAGFPLIYGDSTIGFLGLYHDTVRPYEPSDVALGEAFANQTAIAVQNTRFLQQTERRATQLGLLNRIVTRVASSLRPEDLFETLVEELHTTLAFPFVSIQLVQGDHLRVMAQRGYRNFREGFGLTEGVIGRTARTGQAVLIEDVSRDTDYFAVDSRVTQEACVPIFQEGRVAGVINVEVIEPTLTLADLDLLTALAGYAAVAIENAQLYEQTRHLAATDGLTGLLNYRAFRQTVDLELERAKRYVFPLSVLMIEVDRFKRYNDTFGHLQGDEVLRLVTRVLMKEHRRQMDTAGRYGGDEFVLLLPHTPKTAAAEVAERVRRVVESTPFIVGSSITSVTLSLGVASYPDDGETTDALIDAADRRMYAAKGAGGNAVALTTTS
jgi:diguanylate cyclase (GGDEF)-like protein